MQSTIAPEHAEHAEHAELTPKSLAMQSPEQVPRGFQVQLDRVSL